MDLVSQSGGWARGVYGRAYPRQRGPHVTRGAGEAAVFAAMQAFRFPVMGFSRTYRDFYRGFALTISLLLLMMTVMAWQVGGLAQRFPRQALPMAIVLQLACVGLLALGWLFFFGARS